MIYSTEVLPYLSIPLCVDAGKNSNLQMNISKTTLKINKSHIVAQLVKSIGSDHGDQGSNPTLLFFPLQFLSCSLT